ncbi:RNA helicase Mov10l1 [Holothuria leucospilota]|uniref:RNA helicase n=1 Tax=Holothuria leucospilota TaxID=206669 RepID=A0A9Q1CM32_HOLLE|nr:RNA helicase Mov10l1 [Holothuria leucospilota]
MFSTAHRLIKSLWSAPEEESLVAEDAAQYPSEELDYGTSIELLLDTTIKSTTNQSQSRFTQISGKITHVFGDYGLIDDEIYFSLSSVLDRACPVVGAKVQAVVENLDVDGSNKKAISVAITSDWFDEKDNIKDEMEEVLVGKVTKWDTRTGLINDQIEFSRDALPYDFKPYRGDWVKVEIVHSTVTGKSIAKTIKPLREKNFAGELTHAYPGYGFIDGVIYFSFASCDGFRPQKGDWLTGVAIESDQNRGKWRGMKVFKKRRPEQRNNTEILDEQPQTKLKEEQSKNKGGIIVSEVKDEAMVAQLEEKLNLTLTIQNTTQTEQQLKEVKVSSCAGVTTVKMYTKESPLQILHPPLDLAGSSSTCADISFSPRYLGRATVLATFVFDNFEILREIKVDVHDSGLKTLLGSVVPAVQGGGTKKSSMEKWKERMDRGQVLSLAGVRPPRTYDYNVPVKLPGYPVSKELQQCIMNKGDVRDVRPVLTEPLMMENYSRRFSALLHLEEVQMDIDIRMFDLEKVSMKPWREFLALEVPGLAEGRPSVLVGDKIILSSPDAGSHSMEFEGFVHEVHGEHILLKFNPAFHETYRAENYNVRFTFSRTPIRRCHQACEFAPNLGVQVLFPVASKSRPPQVDVLLNTQTVHHKNRQHLLQNIVRVVPSPESKRMKIKSFLIPLKGEDKFIVPQISMEALQEKNRKKSGKMLVKYFNNKLNHRQKAAVVRILQGESRPIPYILFGPPGTGKTVTVVEAILQVHHQMSHSRILACTPSNSAADLLTQRLHASGKVEVSNMVRLNAFRRQEEAIPEEIIPYCVVGDDLEVVARHSIIIATCSSAGSFYQLGLKAGHFTHVFIDEAGQATEPEAMVVVALSVGRDGQSILAGDPCQLGPVLRSDLAKRFGLEQSLLERLMNRDAYQRNEVKFRDHGCYDPLLVTKLVENYRSHPALLQLSSDLFYHGELEPRAERTMRESLCKWNQLPNQNNFPLLFHGIKGEDLKEGNSPSWFNPVEAVQSVKYLQALLADEKLKLTPDQIGIITPYRKQVEKIKLLLTSLCIQGVKVGSVEEFQGQERLVIIISTVRSDDSLIGFDTIHHLGFVSSPKRFNVAITRPQALLIIVGNPHVLATDAKWRALLKYCSQNNAYIGCEVPDLTHFEQLYQDEDSGVDERSEYSAMDVNIQSESKFEDGERKATSETNLRKNEMVPLTHNSSNLFKDSPDIERDSQQISLVSDVSENGILHLDSTQNHDSETSDQKNGELTSRGPSPGKAATHLESMLEQKHEPFTCSPFIQRDLSRLKGQFDSSEKVVEECMSKQGVVENSSLVKVSTDDMKQFEETCRRLEGSLDMEKLNMENDPILWQPANGYLPSCGGDENQVPIQSTREQITEDLFHHDEHDFAAEKNNFINFHTGPHPESNVSSRSSSPLGSETSEHRQEKHRRHRTNSTSKLACNFQKSLSPEREKRKTMENFMKGKGRGLILQQKVDS